MSIITGCSIGRSANRAPALQVAGGETIDWYKRWGRNLWLEVVVGWLMGVDSYLTDGAGPSVRSPKGARNVG